MQVSGGGPPLFISSSFAKQPLTNTSLIITNNRKSHKHGKHHQFSFILTGDDNWKTTLESCFCLLELQHQVYKHKPFYGIRMFILRTQNSHTNIYVQQSQTFDRCICLLVFNSMCQKCDDTLTLMLTVELLCKKDHKASELIKC